MQERIYLGRHSVVHRAWDERAHGSVILKMPAAAYPPAAEVAALEHEYELARSAAPPRLVRHLGIITSGSSRCLVVEDFGGRSMADYLLDAKLDVETFLRVAIEVTRGLGELHNKSIVHKDMNPGNIIYNPSTGVVKLCDLGLASLLRQEKQEFHNPKLIEGTLAYIAPEQTGRMNRAIDFRTDFYSLGATFHQMLAGVPPFDTTDPIELIHCHIAKTPMPPAGRSLAVPKQLWDIVLKLMAKNAEDRYQSAEGLEADLLECQKRLTPAGHIELFPLGRSDISPTFRISEKLYGREAQVQTLLRAFDRAASGELSWVLVGGYSGAGKSVLVREIHKPVAARRGYFLTGKCDYVNTQQPLSAFVEALVDLVRQILTESEDQLLAWRSKLSGALHGNGQVLVDLIPDIALILGEQPPVIALPPLEARERIESALQSFLLAFATEEHPVVIFLDDLQWIDPAALRLLSQIAVNPAARHLLLIGAYRENEVSAAHPLMMTVDDITEAGRAVIRVNVGPLSIDDVGALVSDSLHEGEDAVRPLRDVIVEKTGGNPFFITQLLHALHDDRLLRFDPAEKRWAWDIDPIRALGVSDNVVDLMVAKIRKYPEATQNLLVLASSMGNTFDLQTLSIISASTPREAAHGLWETVRDGLVLPLDNRYNYYQWTKEDREDAPAPEEVRYRFAHDRIQEAAYSQIAESRRGEVSLRIGRLLLSKIPPAARQERIFDVVGHLNLGAGLMTARAEKEELAHLNLLAGRRAKAATAYQAAVGYLARGIDLLPEDAWASHYNLMFELHRERTECEYLSGDLAKAEEVFAVTAKHATTREHIADIYQLMIRITQTAAKIVEGVRLGEEVLRLFDLEMPSDPQRAMALIGELTKELTEHIGSRDVLELVDAPTMEDRDWAMCLVLLHETWSSAVMASEMVQVLLTSLYMMVLSLRHGHSEYSSAGYIAWASALSIQGQPQAAYGFGRLAMMLNEKFHNPLVIPKVNNTFGNFVNWFRNHVKTNIPVVKESYQYALQSGDRWWGAWAAGWIRTCRLIKGDPLADVAETINLYHDYIKASGYEPHALLLQMEQHAIWNLQGETDHRLTLSRGKATEEKLVGRMRELGFDFGLHWYFELKGMVHYLYEDYDAALAAIMESVPKEGFVPITVVYPDSFLFCALINAAAAEKATGEAREACLAMARDNTERMRGWAEHCPDNFKHKYLLMSAEIARVTGEGGNLLDRYDEAIATAHEYEFLHHEALANELAARYCLERNRPKAAKGYMMEARYLYQRWGATEKVAQLDERYESLLVVPDTALASSRRGAAIDAQHTGKVEVEALDLHSVLKAAQALSSEIVLTRVLERMMRIAMENAGAQRGVLLVERDGELLVEAAASVESQEIQVHQSIPMEQSPDLPRSIVQYVQRTGNTITLDDACADPRFRTDPYIAKHQVKSVLCLPSVRKAGRISVFYLENNLARGAFTPERTRTLQLLSTQAAISLENAVLYDTLEQRVETRTRELRDKNQELYRTLSDLKEAQDRMVVQSRLASLGALTAGIAHELRNPLNFINNFATLSKELSGDIRTEAETLTRGPDPEAAAALSGLLDDLETNMGKIGEHGSRAAAIIKSMLEHYREGAGDREPTDLNSLVQSYIDLAYHGMRSRDPSFNTGIEVTLDRSIGKVNIAPQEVGRVLISLVDNACYATKVKQKVQGGPAYHPNIQVKTRALPDAVEIRVRDNGTGIQPAAGEKIFNPFFTTKPSGEGTGLGLSIAYDIVVRANGGTITFDTREGEFTEFVVTIPRR
ncbi:Signal transduction histidine kinase CheA [Minicystis rosea]|nr:Signal transduction histidine kinase CheA [Minicystis rosea]